MTLEEFIKECELLRNGFKWSKGGNVIRGKNEQVKDTFCPITALYFKRTGEYQPKCQYRKISANLGIRGDDTCKILRAADNVDNHADSLPLFNQLCVALGITK